MYCGIDPLKTKKSNCIPLPDPPPLGEGIIAQAECTDTNPKLSSAGESITLSSKQGNPPFSSPQRGEVGKGDFLPPGGGGAKSNVE